MWESIMKRLKDIYQKITGITAGFNEDHVGAYAAQSAYFFMLCMIPIILLLLTMVQYKGGCNDRRHPSVPVVCGKPDNVYCESGI